MSVNLCESYKSTLLSNCDNRFVQFIIDNFKESKTAVIVSHEQDNNNVEFSTKPISVKQNICPVQFAHYVKLYTAVENELTGGDWKTTLKYINDYNEHFYACDCDSKVHNGIRAVCKGIQIHLRRLGFIIHIR